MALLPNHDAVDSLREEYLKRCQYLAISMLAAKELGKFPALPENVQIAFDDMEAARISWFNAPLYIEG